MKNYKILYSALVVMLFGMFACTDNFDEINTNPNSPNEGNITTIEPFISHVQRHIFAPDRYSSWRGNLIYGARCAEQFSFGFAGTWFPNGAGIDGSDSGWNDASWDQPIDRNIGTLGKLDELTSSEGAFNDPAANAVVTIMKSFLIQRITDLYGEMPYSELGQALFPIYDTQADLYAGVMSELKSAIEVLKGNGADPITSIAGGDFMFAGDSQKWIDAGNTLRLRMALRSNSVAQNSSVIDECLNESFISSNANNVQLAQDPNETENVSNSWFSVWDTWLNTETGSTPAGWVVAHTLIEKLKLDDDPRLFYFAQPIAGSPAGEKDSYQGGLVAALSETYPDISELSLPTDAMLSDASFPIIEMTYAESRLLQAEANMIKGNLGDAQMHYMDGIRASMEQWNVSLVEIDEYFSSSSAAILSGDPTTAMNQIGIQRWIAAYTNGREAWAILRRFDGLGIYPDKTFGNDVWASTTGSVGAANQLPQRMVYPQSEITLNSANVQDAISRQGPDLMTTELWWAK